MTVSAKILVNVSATDSNALDLGTGTIPYISNTTYTISDGTGANSAEAVFADQRTLTTGGNEDLDLAGSLTDGYGNTITFTKIKGIFVKNSANSGNAIEIGGATGNQFINWVGDGTDQVVVDEGGMFLLYSPIAAGYAVTAGTGDLLRITNTATSANATYDIILIGETS